MRRSGAVNGVREFDPEGQLLSPADRVEHDRQSRMRRRPRAEPTEIFGIAGHNDPVVGDRAGEDIRVRGATQAELLDVQRIHTMRRAEMTGEQRRKVLVDQEARRHNLPPGVPAAGLPWHRGRPLPPHRSR